PSLLIWEEVLRDRSKGGITGFLKRIIQIILKCGLIVLAVCMLAGMYLQTGKAPGRIFILDNTASMSAKLRDGSAPYEKAREYLKRSMKSSDTLYIISPRIKHAAFDAVPADASQSERNTADAANEIISLNRGKQVIMLTDNNPAEQYSSSEQIEWHSMGEKVQSVGILSGCIMNKSIYITLQNTYPEKKSVLVEVWADGKKAASSSVGIDQGIHEVSVETDAKVKKTVEVAIKTDEDGFETDNYFCFTSGKSKRDVCISGDSLPECFTSFLQAASLHTVRVSLPRQNNVNIIRGKLPNNCLPGEYLLIEPEGSIHTLSFSKLKRAVLGNIALSEKPENAGITEYVNISPDEKILLTNTVEKGGESVFQVNKLPGAGLYEGEGYRIVYLLCRLDNSVIPKTPAFPVLMQNIMDFLFRVKHRFALNKTGNPVQSPGTEFSITRKGSVVRRVTPLEGALLYLEEPGLYTAGGTIILGVNPSVTYEDLDGEKSRLRFGKQSAYSGAQGKDLFFVLWISVIACMSLLAILEK
ncbi:hypothetical protein ACFL6F_04235, partial [Planctomycetota bacterium]